MHVTCTHCGNEWDYGGDNDHNATCPDCLRKTPVDD